MAAVGTVKAVIGVVQAKASDGTIRVLAVGDPIYEGDIINPVGPGSHIEFTLNNGKEMALDEGDLTLLDQTVLNDTPLPQEDITAEQQAILNGSNLPTEDTAAGITGPNSDGGIVEPFVANRTDDRGDVDTYHLDTDANSRSVDNLFFNGEQILGQIDNVGSEVVDTTASATITVDNITTDDILNATEAAGTVTVTGTVGGDAEAGDTVTFNVNGTDYSAIVAADKTWSVDVAGSDLENDTSFDATVTGSYDNGNEFSATTTSTHTVDTTTSATVDIKDDSNNDDMISTIDDQTATKLSGTIEAGGTITALSVSDGTNTITIDPATITVNTDGSWSTTTDVSSLNDGTLTVSLDAQDALGNPAQTVTDTISKDTVTPVTIDTISDTNDNTPTISGTGEAGSTIVLLDENNTQIGTATVAADGTWSTDVNTTLGDGSHTITANATDPYGNTNTTTSAAFTVDTTTSATVDIKDDSNNDDMISTIDDQTATKLSGTIEAGGTITALSVSDGTNTITIDPATITVNTDGSWSTTTDVSSLNDGTLTVSLDAQDALGNPAQTVTDTISKDTVTPVTIDTISDTNDNTPTISGTGEAGSTIVLLDENNTQIGTATVAADGTWSTDVNTTLGDGSHTITANATDPYGNTNTTTSAAFTVDTTTSATVDIKDDSNNDDMISTIDDQTATKLSGTIEAGGTITALSVSDGTNTITIDPATITVNTDGSWSTTTDVSSLNDGTLTVSLDAQDALGNPAQTVTDTISKDTVTPVTIDTISDTNDNTPTISGTGEAGSTIVLLDENNTQIGTATVAADGTWSTDVNTTLGDGSHTITANATDPYGNTNTTTSAAFTVDTTTSATVDIKDDSNNDDMISTIDDQTATKLSGTIEAGGTITALSVSDGTNTITIDPATITVNTDGSWSTTTDVSSLNDGTLTVSLDAQDALGNPAQTVTDTISKDTVTPVTIDTISDTNDNTPTISGTGEAGSTIVLLDENNTQIGTATVAADGTWSTDVNTTLGDGSHTITANATDPYGNTNTTTSAAFTVDTTTSATVDIKDDSNNDDMISTIDDQTATKLSGTIEAGGTITALSVSDGTNTITIDPATITVNTDGSWSTTTDVSSLNDGTLTVSLDAQDALGNPAQTVTDTISKDTVTPVTIDTISDTNDNTPTISGTGEAGSTIVLLDENNTQIGTATVAADGTWSTDVNTTLGDGSHTITANATDPYGNTNTTTSAAFTVDTTTSATVDIKDDSNNDDMISTIDDQTATKLSGTIEAGGTITALSVSDGTNTITIDPATITVNTDGSWSTTTDVSSLNDGTLTVSLDAQDALGNPAQTVTDTISKDTVTPVTIDTISDTNDNTPTISGTGEAGSTIVLLDENNTQIGTATVAADGTWSTDVNTTLGDGSHTITANATDPYGNTNTTTSAAFTVDTTTSATVDIKDDSNNDDMISTIDDQTATKLSGTIEAGGTITALSVSDGTNTITIDPATITVNTDGSWSTTTDVSSLNDGTLTVSLDAQDALGNPAQTVTDTISKDTVTPVTIDTISDTNDNTPTISGTGEAGSTIVLLDENNTQIGTATVAADGTWSTDVNTTLGDGSHTITANATDPYGNTNTTTSAAFTVDTTTSATVDIKDDSNNDDMISTIDDQTATKLSGTIEAGGTITALSVSDGTNTITIDPATITVNTDGSWSTTTDVSSLNDGTLTVSLDAQDALGNPAQTVTDTISKDTVTPVTIDTISDTNDNTPTISGTGEAGSTIVLLDENNTQIGTATVAADGTWSTDVNTTLGDGSHTITANATDPYGNTNTTTSAAFTVDTTTSATVDIKDDSNNDDMISTIDDQTATKLSGTIEAGGTITALSVSDGTNTITIDPATITVNTDGSWSTTTDVSSLNDGTLTVSLDAQDALGNPAQTVTDTISKDTVTPVTIDTISDTNDNTPTISGTGEAGSTIVLLDENNTQIGTATVAADGTWSTDVNTTLGDGSHTITANATDPYGNTNTTTSAAFTVDTTTSATVDIKDDSNNDDMISTIDDQTATKLSGTIEAGGTITALSVSDGTNTITIDPATITVNTDGSWSTTTDVSSLNDGTLTVSLDAQDALGNPAQTVTDTISKDTVTPVTIDTISDTNDNTPTISGTGEAGSTIVLLDENNTQIGTATVAADGTWSTDVNTTLGDGSHTITANATDPYGNTNTTTSAAFTVDTTTSATVDIKDDSNNDDMISTIDDQTATKLSGTIEAGGTITALSVSDGTNTITIDPATITVNTDGSWSTTTDVSSLNDGTLTVSLDAQDALGNPAQTVTDTISKDTVTPVTIDTISDTNDNTPTISGTGEAGSTIVLLDENNTQIGTATVAADGTWSTDVNTTLGDGSHTITANATDPYGNTNTTTSAAFTVDTTTSATVDIKDDSNNDDMISTIDDQTATKLSGTIEAGGTITALSVSDGTNTITIDPATITVNTDGSWSTTTDVSSLNDGTLTVSLDAQDALGNPAQTVTDTISKDTVTPVTIDTISDTNDNTPTISGTGEAGSTIVLLDENNTQIGTATVAADGTWSTDVNTTLGDGSHTITANATDPYGNTNTTTSAAFTVDTTTSATVDIKDDSNNDDMISTIDDQTATKLSGTIEAGGTITALSVSDGTNTITIDPATITVNTDGSWSTTTDVSSLNDGTLTVSLDAQDALGNPAQTVTDTISKDTVTPVTIDTISDTNDNTPTISGTGEAGSTIVLLDENNTQIGTATVAADGTWSTDVNTTLGDGSHTITANATDPYGNTNTTTSAAFTVDTTTSATVDIKDDSNNDDMISTIDDQTATKLSGTIEAGGTITALSVSDGTNTITIDPATITVNTDGSWSTTTDVSSLNDGTLTVSLDAQDALGNPAQTVTDTISKDTVTPVTIDTISDTNDNTPTISGTGEAGSTIVLLDENNTQIGTATVAADGTWSTDVNTTLGDGSHTITANATDPYGNTNTTTSAAFTVDTTTSATVDIKDDSNNDDMISTIDDQTATKLSGTIEAGGTITALSVSDGTNTITIDPATITVNTDGSWSTTTDVSSLNDGTLTVSLDAQDALGNPAQTVTDTISKDTVTPVTIDTISDTNDNTPTISGTGEAGSTIVLLDENNTQIGTATVAADGTWSTDVNTTLGDGSHTITANATDPYGNTNTTTSAAFTVDTEIILNNKTIEYNENQQDNAVIGTLDNNSDIVDYVFKNADPNDSKLSADGYYHIDDDGQITITALGVASEVNDYEQGLNSGIYTVIASDAAGNTTEADITLKELNVNEAPTAVDDSARVSEEGLVNGLVDTTGANAGDDITDSRIYSGTINISDVDGDTLSVTLDSSSIPTIKSNGVDLDWTGGSSNADGSSDLVGSANGNEIISVHVENNGDYTVTLSGPVDHPENSVEDVLSFDVGVNVSDGTNTANSTTSATLSIGIEDDMPVATNITQSIELPIQNTNLMLVLDVSGSMNDPSGIVDSNGNSLSRLDVEKQAVIDLINSYEEQGSLMVRVVPFSTHADPVGSIWVDAQTAINQVNSLSAGGWTNYDGALFDAMASFSDSGKLLNGQNVSYFITDGKPRYADGDTSVLSDSGGDNDIPDVGIQASEETTWTTFLSNNNINSIALGIGTGVTADNINPIAYNGITNTNSDGKVVTDLSQVSTYLSSTVSENLSGNLLSGNIVTDGFSAGADGGHLNTIAVDGDIYTFDGVSTLSISGSGNTSYTFDSATNTVSITTVKNSVLTVDLDDGDYTMVPDSTMTQDYTENITFSLVDNDGDEASATATFDISREANSAPNSVDSSVTAVEDTSYILKASDFGFNDVNAGDSLQAVRIETLPTNGTIYLNGTAITASTEVTVAQLNNNELTFIANANESGSDEYITSGVGDQFSDYATFTYNVSDGVNWSATSATMTLDVTAVADAPTLNVGSTSTVRQSIDISNVTSTTDGYTVTAFNADGSNSTISIHGTAGSTSVNGFGVSGNASGNTDELGYLDGTGSEKLSVHFDQEITSVDIAFSWKANSSEDGTTEDAVIEFYKNGTKVGEVTDVGGTDGNDSAKTFQPSNGSSFDEIVFSAPGQYDDYLIHEISFDRTISTNDTVVTNEGVPVDLSISTSLVDTDGSESITSLTVSDIPDGAILSDGTNTFTATASSSSVDINNWNLNSLTFNLPTGIVTSNTTYALNVTSTTTESSNGSIANSSETLNIQVNSNNQVISSDVSITNDITTGIGDDTISTTNDIRADISTGAGNDTITVGDDIQNGSVVNTGTGNDTITVTDIIKDDDTTINMGDGDDNLTVSRIKNDNISIDMGDGDDIMTITGNVIRPNNSIIMGSGQDTLVFDNGLIADNIDITYNNDGTIDLKDNISGYNINVTFDSLEKIQFTADNTSFTLGNDGTFHNDDPNSAVILDAIVEGLTYTTSSGLTGLTDADGSFDYLDGDIVTFTLGNVTIGSVDMSNISDDKVFLQDIANVDRTDLNDEYVENMAVLLQSLDANSDAYDGIVITQEMRDAFSNENFDLASISEDDLRSIIENTGRVAVSEDDAMTHVQDVLETHTDIDSSEFSEHISDHEIDQNINTQVSDDTSGLESANNPILETTSDTNQDSEIITDTIVEDQSLDEQNVQESTEASDSLDSQIFAENVQESTEASDSLDSQIFADVDSLDLSSVEDISDTSDNNEDTTSATDLESLDLEDIIDTPEGNDELELPNISSDDQQEQDSNDDTQNIDTDKLTSDIFTSDELANILPTVDDQIQHHNG
ncbi:Ig-like domain-containing protein [Sulfurospirillum sp. 1307]